MLQCKRSHLWWLPLQRAFLCWLILPQRMCRGSTRDHQPSISSSTSSQNSTFLYENHVNVIYVASLFFNFGYRCSSKCDFIVDLTCGINPLPLTIEQPKSHHHPVVFLKERAERAGANVNFARAIMVDVLMHVMNVKSTFMSSVSIFPKR